MKKITLLFLFLTVGYTIQAQTISFEASEGFSLGPISGQNGWGRFGGDGSNLIINNAQASDGTFSLELIPTNGQAITGALSPTTSFTQDAIVTVDMYLESIATGELSNADFATQGNGIATRVIFSFDGNVYVYDDTGGAFTPINTSETVIRDAWFELKIEHVYSTGDMRYYINNVLFYTGSTFSSSFSQTVALFDNYESSAIFDNIVVQDGLNLNIEDNIFIENSISLFPNPTDGELNIKFYENVGLTRINIIDITGQRVLNTVFDGVGNRIINTDILANGVYFAQIATEFGNTTIKFIKN